MAIPVRAFFLLCMLLFAAAAQGAPVLDQEHAPVGNFGALAVANDRTVIQSFTVGTTGALIRIDVQVTRQPLTAHNLDFSLWSTDAAGVRKDLLATASVPPSALGVPFSFPFVSFDLGAGVPVTEGDVLAIALNANEPNDAPHFDMRYLWQYGGQYAPGAASVQVGASLLPQTEDLHFRTFVQPLIQVTLEVRRGKGERIHPSAHGLLSVAILSTDTFDASLLDVATIRFGRTGSEAAAVDTTLHDVNQDRRADLVLKFGIPDTGIQCGDTIVSITGKTVTGASIVGSDDVVTAGCR